MILFFLLLAILIYAIFAAGCASPPGQVSLSQRQTEQAIAAGKPAISPRNLTCRPEPRSPGGGATDGQAAAFVLDLTAAGRDCRSKLQAVRETLEGDQ